MDTAIATEIQALQQDKAAMISSLEGKGVVVPDGSGFDSFASLIDSINTKKVHFATRTLFEGSSSGWMTFENISFEPKALVFSCLQTVKNTVPHIPDVSGKSSYCLWSYHYSYLLTPDQTPGLLNAIYAMRNPNPNVTPLEYVSTISSSHSLSQDAVTGLWTVRVGRDDTAVSAFRYAGNANGIPYQLIVLG